MSNDWDFYSCRVDDEPASIFVDLGIRRDVPLGNRQYMAFVRLFMRAPRPDGLSSQEEFEELIRLEDQVTAALAAHDVATYVGRNTSGGCRDFYFYVSDPGSFTQRVSAALADFPEYKYEVGSRLDKDWTTYFEFLYPSPEDMERIQNRRVCESLQKNGDALSEPREIDHWAYFPDEDSRARFLIAIEPLGFKVRELKRWDDDDRAFGIQFFRVDLPSFEAIDSVTLPLHRAAIVAGGDYDGWETQVIS
jgi:uncharacterized protein (TIGR01619 family)